MREHAGELVDPRELLRDRPQIRGLRDRAPGLAEVRQLPADQRPQPFRHGEREVRDVIADLVSGGGTAPYSPARATNG